MGSENNVYLSIGSNLGGANSDDCKENLVRAIKLIKEKFVLLKISSFYKSAPVDYTDQDWFYNACIYLKTDMNPFDLMDFFQEMEMSMGQRSKKIRFGPRIIDIDIIFYENLIINTEKLTLPHARMHERAFVLLPLMEINNELIHPVFKKSLSEIFNSKRVLNQECIKL